jgi:hypothetical protein
MVSNPRISVNNPQVKSLQVSSTPYRVLSVVRPVRPVSSLCLEAEPDLRHLIRDASDQLCQVVDGNLDFVVQVPEGDDDFDKLLLLVNFVSIGTLSFAIPDCLSLYFADPQTCKGFPRMAYHWDCFQSLNMRPCEFSANRATRCSSIPMV